MFFFVAVLADANFPTSSLCREGPKEVRADGHTIPALLQAVLQLMPLDTYCWSPVSHQLSTSTAIFSRAGFPTCLKSPNP